MAFLFALFLSYGPYARPLNGGDVAVAPSRGGALLAWSEADRIRVGLLDAHGRLLPAIHTLPATSPRVVAVAPAAAGNGVSFFVAWIELEGGNERTMGMLAGLDGRPAVAPRPYAVRPIPSNDFALRLVWDGRAWRLWTAGRTLTIGADGAVLASADAVQMPHSVAVNDGIVGTSTWRVTVSCGFGWCSTGYALNWTAGSASGSLSLGSTLGRTPPVGPSVIAAAGDRFAIAWAAPGGVSYLVTGDGANLVSARPEMSVAPGLACSETRCTIAYSQSKDVHALVFPIDRLTGPELLTIAATERAERAPQVHLLGPERFLVTWRSDGADGARLNWQVLTYGTPRRRATR